MTENLPKSIQELLAHDNLSDIFINGVNQVWGISRAGQVLRIASPFDSEEELTRVAIALAAIDGKRLDQACPFADISLGGQVRAHAVLASGCSPSTLISLRIHQAEALSLSQLADAGFATAEQAAFLRRMIRERKSFLISGATGAGKTTLLRSLLSECRDERLVILEDTPELALDSQQWVAMRTRSANIEGRGLVDLESLVVQSLRMNPQRIVLGEVRSREIVPLLQALNTGHEGSATTLHANSLFDVPNRLLAIGKSAGLDSWVLSELACSAIKYVIHVGHADGDPAVTGRRIEAIGRFAKTKQGWLEVKPVEFESNRPTEVSTTVGGAGEPSAASLLTGRSPQLVFA